MSHDPSKIILIGDFVAQTFLIITVENSCLEIVTHLNSEYFLLFFKPYLFKIYMFFITM